MWYMRQKEEFGEDRSQGIRFYDNTQTCDYLPHWHMTYEVIMVIAEDLTVIVENERHLLHPGDIMVIPSGVVHEIHTPPTGHRYYFLLDRERLFYRRSAGGRRSPPAVHGDSQGQRARN